MGQMMLYIKIVVKDSWKPLVSKYQLLALSSSYFYLQGCFKAVVPKSLVFSR